MKNLKKIVLLILCHIVPPALMIIGVEIMQKGSLDALMQWIAHYPNAFLLNYGIALVLLIFLWTIIGNLYISFGVYFFTSFLLALLNVYKIKFLGEPIFPWDIFLSKQVFDLFPHIYKETNILFVLFLILFLSLMIILVKWLPSPRLDFTYRIVGGILSVVLLISLSFYNSTPLVSVFQKVGVRNVTWVQNDNYRDNGVFLSFFMNMQSAIIIPPPDYGKGKMKNILNDITKKYSSQTSVNLPLSPIKKPNVIFVMSESFSDPTYLSNVFFSQDPLPNFHSLLRNGKASWMLTPQMGGGTANVEFEVLTGFNMSSLPGGSIPYQQYVNHPIPSLPAYFANEGYRTLAIHPYKKEFWNREQVYKNIGFQNFISLEQFHNPKRSGGYFVDDSEVTQSIIQETENSHKPVFIFAVTIQNHGTYHLSDHKYPKFPVKISGNISDQAKENLYIYSNGLLDGDKQIRDLMTYFRNSHEPTIVVFFGDHLPSLSVYKETKFVSQDKVNNTNTTPLVIWTNYGKKPEKLYNTVSASFLGTYVFELAGMNPPLFFSFLQTFRDALPGYSPKIKINNEGKMVRETPQSLLDLENKYKLLQYDLLFGKQYGNITP